MTVSPTARPEPGAACRLHVRRGEEPRGAASFVARVVPGISIEIGYSTRLRDGCRALTVERDADRTPTGWPQSPRLAMHRARSRTKNGPDHFGPNHPRIAMRRWQASRTRRGRSCMSGAPRWATAYSCSPGLQLLTAAYSCLQLRAHGLQLRAHGLQLQPRLTAAAPCGESLL